MSTENTARGSDIGSAIALQRLPRWAELPDLELYMDQVLGLMSRWLGGYPGYEEKQLTSSMVNNYVKHGIMPAPVKRKYARTHLAHLIVICILKSSLPIAAIQRLIASELAVCGEEEFYDRFCQRFETINAAAARAVSEGMPQDDPLAPLYCSALRAQAEQALALRLYAALLPEETEKDKAD